MSLLESILCSLELECPKWDNPYVLISVGFSIGALNQTKIEKMEKDKIIRDILRPVAYSQKEKQGEVVEGKKPFFACFPVKSSDEFGEHVALYLQWERNPGNDILKQVAKALEGLVKEINRFYEKQTYPDVDRNIRTPESIQENRHILYISEKMASLRREMQNEDTFTAPVIFIEGETGTGKELVAEYLYNFMKNSKKTIKPDVKITEFFPYNCSRLSADPNMQQIELFGCIENIVTNTSKRVGIFENNDGGVIFLDEINSMSLDAQAMLLRTFMPSIDKQNKYKITITVLGTTKPKDIYVQIICASNQPLQELVKQGKFREDFMYRLQKTTLYVPPLRERGNMDIDMLIDYFLNVLECENSALKEGYHLPISEKARKVLRKYDWPGNVRELEIVLKQAQKKAWENRSKAINPEHLMLGTEEIAVGSWQKEEWKSFERIEYDYYKKVLEWIGDPPTQTKQAVADAIGIDLGTFAKKRKYFELPWPGEKFPEYKEFSANDFLDTKDILCGIKEGNVENKHYKDPGSYLWYFFKAKGIQIPEDQESLVKAFNLLLRQKDLFQKEYFPPKALRRAMNILIHENLGEHALLRINRMLLEDIYPNAIKREDTKV